METRAAHHFETDRVPCPGETIRDLLEELGMTQSDFALRLGRTEKMVSQLLNCKAPVTPETALDLERVLRVPANFWNNAERRYQDWLVRRHEASQLPRALKWAAQFPVKEMAEYGWIPDVEDSPDKTIRLLEFFGVASPESWSGYWQAAPRMAFRRSPAYATDWGALTAWLRQGEIQGQSIPSQPFNRSRFSATVQRAREYTLLEPTDAVQRLQGDCAASGVAFVLVPELPGISCWGVTRWLSPSKALIQMCLRCKRDDQFWFSFFHEASHVLLHGKRTPILECDDEDSEQGTAANRFAGDLLIPPQHYESLVGSGDLDSETIERFAAKLGIAPGIVLGRLQHDGHVSYNQFNELKRRFSWVELGLRM